MKFLLVPLLIIGMFVSFAVVLLVWVFYINDLKSLEDAKALISPQANFTELSEELLMREDKLDSLFRQVEGYRVLYDERFRILAEWEDSLNAARVDLVNETNSLKTIKGEKKVEQDSAVQKLRAENIANLVKYYSAMKPARAAEILNVDNGLSDDLVAEIINRLAPVKAGKIMSFMEPEDAARITKTIQDIQ